jgi:hypothetical protein
MALDNTSSSERQAAFLSALVTEHCVLQTAASATVSEAASRTSLYVFSLSSSLVAMGFVSQFPATFRLFAAAILPALFVSVCSQSFVSSTLVSRTSTCSEASHVFAPTTARSRLKPPRTSPLTADAGRRRTRCRHLAPEWRS